jgi:DNA processing protein
MDSSVEEMDGLRDGITRAQGRSATLVDDVRRVCYASAMLARVRVLATRGHPMTARPAGQRRRAGYVPPPPDQIVETSLGALLSGRRSVASDSTQPPLFDQALVAEPAVARLEKRIWCAGSTALVQQPCVAIVGTREASDRGASRARRLARELAERGAVVVSGLARGVDTEALSSAITAGGRVVAVIGTPIEEAHPVENARLQETIARDHLLISPFPPGTRTLPRHFPERNRVMAALTDVTAIIEAGDSSGTLHQAEECVRLGRWLFIARSVMEDATLEWPSRFRAHPNVRTLSDTAEILSVLHI